MAHLSSTKGGGKTGTAMSLIEGLVVIVKPQKGVMSYTLVPPVDS